MDPARLEKVDTIVKVTVWVKSSNFDKFKGAYFKYDNSFFKILAQKYSDKGNFGPKFRHFHFFKKFCN